MDIDCSMNENNENTIIRTSFPKIDDLCCTICEIDSVEVRDSSAKSNFHWQTIKCRLLIHLVPYVIASPVSGAERVIFVITPKHYFRTGKLGVVLKNLKLVYQGLRPVTKEVYEVCLIYTIQCKMAPYWSKIDQYLIEGKDFYNSIQAKRAMKLNIDIKGEVICLRLQTKKIKIPFLKIEEFYLPQSILAQFQADPKGYIDLSKFRLPFVHVLPSTKRGKLLSVSKEIPTTCPFKDYDQLRRHWKNMYGYSLPRNKNGIWYYEIQFPVQKSNIFIYPHLCIATAPLQIIQHADKTLTISHFLTDMIKRLPIICGEKVQIFSNNLLNTEVQTINTSPSTNSLLSWNKDLLTQNTEEINPDSSAKLEFSTNYINGLRTSTNNITSSSLQMKLAKIHQIHTTSLNSNMNTNANERDMENKQNKISFPKDIQTRPCNMQAAEITSNEHRELNSLNVSANTKEGESISKYFKIRKTHSSTNSANGIEEFTGKPRTVSLREKLFCARLEDVDMEAMAQSNRLGEVKNSILSNWLKKHSILHNSYGKKEDLINKVLSHIRNTKILHQFRL